MTENDLRNIFGNYLAAFAAPSPAEQERLLRASVADDVVYTNPGVAGSGLRNLLSHIGTFQRRFPGGRFRLDWLRHQHGQVLAEWTQLDHEGAELVTAHSYAPRGRVASTRRALARAGAGASRGGSGHPETFAGRCRYGTTDCVARCRPRPGWCTRRRPRRSRGGGAPARQERLLRASVADDVVYTNPGVAGSGLRNLLSHIGTFQRRFPGGRFRLDWLRHQHGQVLAEWTQLDHEGA